LLKSVVLGGFGRYKIAYSRLERPFG